MARRLHIVFGGELADPERVVFRDLNEVDLVGIFPDYQTAYDAWKEVAQKTVDNARMRYFIADLHRLRESAPPPGSDGDASGEAS